MIILNPGSVTLAELERIYRTDEPAKLNPNTAWTIQQAAVRVAQIVVSDTTVYGINTGLGKLASVRIPANEVITLQRNLILSHCCGVGSPLDKPVVRLIMVLKLISLGRGASGVRLDVIKLLEAMLEHDVMPVIPGQGSVGASGDLAPLAHMVSSVNANAVAKLQLI